MRPRLPILTMTLATLALLLCAPADAQRRMRTRVVSAPAGTQVITTSPSGSTNGSVPVVNPVGTVSTLQGGNSVERLLLGDYPAPGLGFDYTHLAAVNRHLGVRALIDPVTQHRLALERGIRRDLRGRGGIVAPVAPVVVNSIVINVTPQPPVVIIQEPEPEPERIEHARYIEDAPSAPAVPTPFYEPEATASELVFIRRDGSLLFAVAYTVRYGDAAAATSAATGARNGAGAAAQGAWTGTSADVAAKGGRLIYITRDGLRRSVPLAELDLDASREMNEARGSYLQL